MIKLFRKARRRFGKLRRATARLLLSLHKKVRCNLCGWEGHRFLSDEWHKHIVCPRCNSLVRHRMIIAALEHLGPPCATSVDGRKVLHFAPEHGLSEVIRRKSSAYLTADLNRRDVDLQVDMSDMREVRDGEFDTVIACDVIEHIPDDRKALTEIHRILSPGGVAILTVPQKDGLETTFSDPAITDPRQREITFGHHDHLRIYGTDFTELLASCGFEVHEVVGNSFPPTLVRQLVLAPPFPSPRPLATNNQVIFFASKQS